MKNREILFRGKRIDGAEWSRGDLLTWYPTDTDPEKTFTIKKSNGEQVEVDSSTIGQYVGLTLGLDKVFSGDILKDTNGNMCIVMWDEKEFKWSASYIGESLMLSLDVVVNTGIFKLKKIGNIHDNPELLK